MPPFPSKDTIRYRPASNVPGRKRLLREDEELRTPEGELPLLECDEDRGVAGLTEATVCVANTSNSTALPHKEQKRLCSAISLAQDGHFGMESLWSHSAAWLQMGQYAGDPRTVQ
jgi:hypothetical protein